MLMKYKASTKQIHFGEKSDKKNCLLYYLLKTTNVQRLLQKKNKKCTIAHKSKLS